ncbi:leucyl aminopeptidase [Austwickia chelonae]|uniref:Probable cytosol aminopeptidase n=1 Tax=Austwickia chelonae NBRC 105200 TaxID=1184607 RepID=K6V4Z0_9MICO|nr:leucyl aminopeptidase [Austwickia chelonae]GAB77253.1 putative cytosol aminopeptidase [Austwickia chelonae NBRC 105200]SEW06226.1 leucyl aminopeptidase [Austwickia chelonae]
MTTFTLSTGLASEEETDVLVLFASPGEEGPALLGEVNDVLRRRLLSALDAFRARGKADETTWVHGVEGTSAALTLVVGVGVAVAELDGERVRRAAGTAGRSLAGRGSACVVVPGPDWIGQVTEGLAMGAYSFEGYHGEKARAGKAERSPVGEVTLAGLPEGIDATDVRGTLRRAEILASGACWARDLVNACPNELFPVAFAQRVQDRVPEQVKVRLYDEEALSEEQCGGILGVGQGSVHPPRIVHLEYAPEGAKQRLSFVGKGITFDSGGLCIKPAASMVGMKGDMAGAASVAAAVAVIAELGLPVAVDGWLCLAENMPDGNAFRPGDVVTIADGTTCEVINTDAEGRLVLADGIVLASRRQPDVLVDIATLTGAAVVALGHRTAAAMSNRDDLRQEVVTVAGFCGEGIWPMPIPDEVMKDLESDVADRKHAGAREGGALFAAAFLREYVGKAADGESPIPWIHLDIAGPAFHEGSPYGYTLKGGTGFGMRTLVGLAQSRS